MDFIEEIINVDMSFGSKITVVPEGKHGLPFYEKCCYGCRNIIRYSERTCSEPTLPGWIYNSTLDERRDVMKEEIKQYIIHE